MSIDGVVSSPKDWRLPVNEELGKAMSEGLRDVDGIILGRRTYEEFSTIWPGQGDSNPMAKFLNDTPKYILSNKLAEPLTWSGAHLLTGDLIEQARTLRESDGKGLQIPGSPALVARLLEAGLLDELRLIVDPVVVGSGDRMFDVIKRRFEIKLDAASKIGPCAQLVFKPKS